ncbi:hypothetical protein L1887_29393 [Cichorium endivia]|nr:hypothetical protein L1887_29393 [Cichorium endivia]
MEMTAMPKSRTPNTNHMETPFVSLYKSMDNPCCAIQIQNPSLLILTITSLQIKSKGFFEIQSTVRR